MGLILLARVTGLFPRYVGAAEWTAVYGDPGDTPIVGDWDGDGIDTIGVYRNGVFYLRNSNTTGTADITFAFGNPDDIPFAGDWIWTYISPQTVPSYDTIAVLRHLPLDS